MNWLRCNNCYAKAREAKDPFALTKCGHVYCSRCTIQAEKQCVICNSTNVPAVRIQEPLDPHLSLYFASMSDSFTQLLAVSNFQEEQLRITTKRFDEMDAKYVKAKDVAYRIEYEASRQLKKYQKDRESYMSVIKTLKNENSQLKLKLESSERGPFLNYRTNQNGGGSESGRQHTCQKRFDRPDSRVSFCTPVSGNTNNSNSFASSNSDRAYLAALAGSNRTFRIPNSHKVPRSAGARSSASSLSTPSKQIPERLESLLISRN